MKTRSMAYMACALLILAAVSIHAKDCKPLSGADSAAVVKAVLDVHAKMTDAANSPEADKMFEFILDAGPGTIIQDGVLMQSRQEAIESVRAGMKGVLRVERSYDRTRVFVLSKDAALLAANGSATFILEYGRTITRPFAVSEVFVLRDGKWMVLHGHHSVPAAP
jgi:hypothetical protein